MAQGSPLYVLTVETRGLRASVRINDVTVFESSEGDPRVSAEKVNTLLVSGENLFQVRLALPSAIPSVKSEYEAPPFFKIRLQAGHVGVSPSEIGNLVDWQWSQGQMPLTAMAEFEALRQHVELSSLPWHPTWLDASPVAEPEAVLSAFVAEYTNLLRTRNVEALVSLNLLKFQQMAQAFEIDANRLVDGFRNHLLMLFGDGGFAVQTAPPPFLRYLAEGNGRLVRITGANGDPPILVTANGKQMPIELLVAHVAGRWQIVR